MGAARDMLIGWAFFPVSLACLYGSWRIMALSFYLIEQAQAAEASEAVQSTRERGY